MINANNITHIAGKKQAGFYSVIFARDFPNSQIRPECRRIKNSMNNRASRKSVRALLAKIVDYAGLFPPSQVSMPEAVANYAAYRTSDYNWMLGRFVVPVARLDEFAASAKEFFRSGEEVWRLSVLADEDINATVQKIEDFNRGCTPNAVCDALEAKAETAAQIEAIAEAAPPDLDVYVELPLTKSLAELIATLAIKKRRAKIRTGGVTENAFPPAEAIAKFMRVCLAANVPFKCTAGLHHPLRCIKPLTYEQNAPEGTMNGFLNVFLAAALLRQGIKPELIHELLKDKRADDFLFGDDGVLWRQEYFVDIAQLENLRADGAISFGSCSFVEPVEDLQELGWL